MVTADGIVTLSVGSPLRDARVYDKPAGVKQGAATFDFEAGTSSSSSGAEYLFSTGSDRRQLSSTQWTSLVKSCFQRHSPTHVACPPKLLRASFVCWLRSSDTAPEVLKSGTNDKLPTHHHSRNIVCYAGSLCCMS